VAKFGSVMALAVPTNVKLDSTLAGLMLVESRLFIPYSPKLEMAYRLTLFLVELLLDNCR
jgi:hypothetical protein